MSSSSDEGDSSTHNKIVCIYCGGFVDKLVPNRKYCFLCKERMVKECKTCKLPFDDLKFFENQASCRCISCEKRLANAKKRKLAKMEKAPAKKKPTLENDDNTARERLLQLDLTKNRKMGYIPIFI